MHIDLVIEPATTCLRIGHIRFYPFISIQTA